MVINIYLKKTPTFKLVKKTINIHLPHVLMRKSVHFSTKPLLQQPLTDHVSSIRAPRAQREAIHGQVGRVFCWGRSIAKLVQLYNSNNYGFYWFMISYNL